MSSSATAPPVDLAALKKDLESKQKEAERLSKQQAGNKRVQDSLAQAIDLIEKNLTEFKKDEDGLVKEYKRLEHQVEQALECTGSELGEHFDKVDEAVKAVDEKLNEEQGATSELETELAGDLELKLREANRQATFARLMFEALRVKDLQERLKYGQDLYKDAIAISGVAPADAAAKYALLWLANDRLHHTPLVADFVGQSVDFAFPTSIEQYEKALVTAYDAKNDAADAALEAKWNLDAKTAAFDQIAKALNEKRTARKTNVVEAAKCAVAQAAHRPPKK